MLPFWQARVVSFALLALFTVAPPLAAQDPAFEDDLEEALPAGDAGAGPDESGQPIAIELAQGIDLLNDQIAAQEELLKTAQTDREKQLIRNHIRSLQKERRSLESLLLKLVGPDIDVLSASREHQAELRQERDYKTLEKDDRQTQ